MTSEHVPASANDIQGLADKLEALDLHGVEQQLLDELLTRAQGASAEVEAFGMTPGAGTRVPPGVENVRFSDMGVSVGQALGFHIHINPAYIGETEKN